MLEEFHRIKLQECADLRKEADAGLLDTVYTGERPEFFRALQPVNGLPAVIAEYKRASPSRGSLCETLPVEEVTRQYATHAACMSVLTEEVYFRGSLSYLARAHTVCPALPLLRKDFLYDSLQVRKTAQTPASALLLIVRCVPDVRRLRDLREEAERFGMAAVVEIFDREDLMRARESGAAVIQVNARDLDTLHVTEDLHRTLIQSSPPEGGERWIAASGLHTHDDLCARAADGYHAVLVGTQLMEQGRPGQALEQLLKGETTC